jgi:lambda family phage portal protein
MRWAARLPTWLRGTPAVQAPALAPAAPAKRRTAGPTRRSFEGAAVNALTASFSGEHTSLNEDLERSLRILRSRSRQLAKNNDYVKKFLRMVQNHVVGPQGFTLSVPCQRQDGSIDEADKTVCEQAFARWAKRGTCDVTGRLSFVQLLRLLVLLCARDGEALVRRVRDRSLNPFGYALQVIDPVLLDESYRADFPDGRRIRLGVETNAWGRPIAYHLLADVESPWGTRRTRVPAEDIWHLFLQDEPSQVRGVPWIHTALRRLNDLGGYEQAAVIAARVGASNMGFYVPPADQAGNAGALADEQRQQDLDDQAPPQLLKDAIPGMFEELPPGYDFKTFDPDYPHQNFGAFVKAMLRGVSSGIGADYNTLANDLEGVNYSSIRSGKLEAQDEWMCLQGWFREGLLEPLWPEWLDMAFLSGQLAPLPVSKFDKFNVAVWQGRRWPWVDPLKDMQARKLELDSCLTSFSAVMREMGRDPEATWREMEKDKKRLKDLLPKTTPAPTPASAGVAASAPANDKESADDETD